MRLSVQHALYCLHAQLQVAAARVSRERARARRAARKHFDLRNLVTFFAARQAQNTTAAARRACRLLCEAERSAEYSR